MRAHFPEVPLVVDAGIGRPSDAAAAMELGMDAVLLNTAVAKAGDPVLMARAMALAVDAGHKACLADPMERRDMAVPSTPVMGLADLGLADLELSDGELASLGLSGLGLGDLGLPDPDGAVLNLAEKK